MKIRSFLGDQSGSASIYVSMFVMAILVLMSLSFARIMGSGYTETSENQLNLQALYAAETGINDARYRLLNLIDSYNRGARSFAPKVLSSPLNLSSPPTLSSGDRMGESSAVSDDKMVIGAPSASPNGEVYYYELGVATWDYKQTLYGPTGSGQYGQSLVISRDCLFIGDTDNVYIYKYDTLTSSWAAVATDPVITKSATGFGYSLAVNSGGFLAVGAPQENASDGTVYTYEHDLLDCTVDLTTEKSLPGASGGQFGSSIDLNRSNFLVVGAPSDGDGAFHAYGYDDVSLSWTSIGSVYGSSDENEFATKVALNNNNFLAITVNNKSIPPSSSHGAVYVYAYRYDGATHVWDKKFAKSGTAASDFEDASIDLNDGYLAIGVPGMGSSNKGEIHVYAYQHYAYSIDPITNEYEYEQFKGWSDNTKIGDHSGTVSNEEFGYSVSLSEGNAIIIGSPGYSGSNPPGRASIIYIAPDPNFNRDDEFNALLRAECLSDDNETNDPEDAYNYHISDQVKYSCLDIDLYPDLLYYDKIQNDRSLNILLRTVAREYCAHSL